MYNWKLFSMDLESYVHKIISQFYFTKAHILTLLHTVKMREILVLFHYR